MTQETFTKYERARILGARSLQVSMDAPLLLKIDEAELKRINYDPLIIAEMEINANVLPITIKKPMPERGNEKEIERITIDDTTLSDEKKIKDEEETEKEIIESGEMSELTESEDDIEEKAQLSASMGSEDEKMMDDL